MATTAGTFGWRGGRRSGGESVGGVWGQMGLSVEAASLLLSAALSNLFHMFIFI